MSKSRSKREGGVTFLGLLAIAFIVLKLCKVINWSWWWVTAPLWGVFALLLALLLIWCIAIVIEALIDAANNTQKKTFKERLEEKIKESMNN